MASLFSHDKDPLNRTELILQENSEDDLETTENDFVTFKEYFGESDDELNESFYGFEEEYEVMEEDPAVDRTSSGHVIDISKWTFGELKLDPIPKFVASPGFHPDLNIPGDADEYFFYKLFVTDEWISYITTETNTYAGEYIYKEKDNFKPSSEFNKCPVEGITAGKMLGFLALTYYMGIVKKDVMKFYWSVDSVSSTPFPRNVISLSEFYNILSFLHCCSNTDYPSKGQPGYDPRKKLGKVLIILQ